MPHILYKKGDNMYIHEIFASIQGEGLDTGLPCVFVRLYGCNLKCPYCDQPQEPCDRKRMSIERAYNMINSFKVKNVCITGGEPLIQEEVYALVYELVNKDFNVSIETNGSILIPDDAYARSYKYVMDVKGPSSKMAHKNIFKNLDILKGIDEVKFVIADKKDYDFMKKIIRKYPTSATILVSPMFSEEGKPLISNELIQWIIKDKLNVRISTQIHKFLNVQ